MIGLYFLAKGLPNTVDPVLQRPLLSSCSHFKWTAKLEISSPHSYLFCNPLYFSPTFLSRKPITVEDQVERASVAVLAVMHDDIPEKLLCSSFPAGLSMSLFTEKNLKKLVTRV